jgi:hypothetical protein
VATYSSLVRSALKQTAVPRLLAERPAVVLERIARGAGATRWFHVKSVQDLERLSTRLAPGSKVSFYFDVRISLRPYDDETIVRILDLVSAQGDAVVGTICPNGFEMSVEFIGGSNELDEFADGLAPGSQIYVGAFPAPDNDNRDAVTFTLPDKDGVTRRHPH